MSNQLIEMEKNTAIEAFTGDTLKKLLEQLSTEAKSIVPDITTAKGRKDIASQAAKVARSKTYLDGVGKDLVSDWKGKASVVDQKRKLARDTLDALKEEVRKPLTEWEAKEQQRIDRAEELIANMKRQGEQASQNWMELSAEVLDNVQCSVMAIAVDETWEEYQDHAEEVQQHTIQAIIEAKGKRTKYDAEQAELAQMRQDQSEREQKDRDDQIQRDATEKATKDAEQRTQQAEQDAKDAEQRAKDAEEREANAAAEAQQRERDRAEQERLDKEAEDAKRAADVEHRRKINNKAKADFVKELGEDQERLAEFIVQMIASGKISNIKINY